VGGVIILQVWICIIVQHLYCVLHTYIDDVGEAGYLGVFSIKDGSRLVTKINILQACQKCTIIGHVVEHPVSGLM
jgi:hypothetical protein